MSKNQHTFTHTLEYDKGDHVFWPDSSEYNDRIPYPLDLEVTYEPRMGSNPVGDEDPTHWYPEIQEVTWEGELIGEIFFNDIEEILEEAANRHMRSIPSTYERRLP